MARSLRRARGAVIRGALKAPVAIPTGSVLVAGALVMLLGDHAWERPWTDGVTLIAGATGVALILAALGGRRPDWIDPQAPPRDRTARDREPRRPDA